MKVTRRLPRILEVFRSPIEVEFYIDCQSILKRIQVTPRNLNARVTRRRTKTKTTIIVRTQWSISVFNLENIYHLPSCSVGRFHFIGPSFTSRQAFGNPGGGSSHKKWQGMLAENFKFYSQKRLMWALLGLHWNQTRKDPARISRPDSRTREISRNQVWKQKLKGNV